MKDSLIKLSQNQTNPYDAKASDFSVKTPAEGGEAGKDKLVPTPGDPNLASFTVAQSPIRGTAVKCGWGVDLNDGQVTPNVADSY